MTWRPELAGGCEAAKIAPLVVPYLQGRCLDIGSGPGKVWPGLTGIDISTDHGRPITDMAMDGTDLSMFADATFDGVFSSFMLHQLELSQLPRVLREWARVLKIGGHLVLYLPDGEAMPVEADPGRKWAPRAGMFEAALKALSGWELLEAETRHGGDEYGLLVVVRKAAEGWSENLWQRNPGGKSVR